MTPVFPCGLCRISSSNGVICARSRVSPRRTTGFIAHAMKPLIACLRRHSFLGKLRKPAVHFTRGRQISWGDPVSLNESCTPPLRPSGYIRS